MRVVEGVRPKLDNIVGSNPTLHIWLYILYL